MLLSYDSGMINKVISYIKYYIQLHITQFFLNVNIQE